MESEAAPEQTEFDWWAQSQEDPARGSDAFLRQAGAAARQASLDPDDGVAL